MKEIGFPNVPYNPTVPSIFRCKETLDCIAHAFFVLEHVNFEILDKKYGFNNWWQKHYDEKNKCYQASIYVVILGSVSRLVREKLVLCVRQNKSHYPGLKWMADIFRQRSIDENEFHCFSFFGKQSELGRCMKDMLSTQRYCTSEGVYCTVETTNLHYDATSLCGKAQMVVKFPTMYPLVLKIDLNTFSFFDTRPMDNEVDKFCHLIDRLIDHTLLFLKRSEKYAENDVLDESFAVNELMNLKRKRRRSKKRFIHHVHFK